MRIRARSTETSDGGSSFPSNSNVSITTYRHLGGMVVFSLALICRVLHCVVALIGGGMAGNCSSLCRAFRRLVEACDHLHPSLKFCAVRPFRVSIQTRGVTLTSPKVIFLHFKSTTTPDSVKKSVTNVPTASVGSEQLKNDWWNCCPPNKKERDYRPFT